MSVRFTSDVEKERVENRAKKWELLTTESLVHALHYARDHGWKDKKVQVRRNRIDDYRYEYTVEPFERDCSCPNVLKFEDYFGGGETS